MKASLRGQLPPDLESVLIGPIVVSVVHSHFALISFDVVFGGYLIILPKIFYLLLRHFLLVSRVFIDTARQLICTAVL